MTGPAESGWGESYTNIAQDQAQVAAQIGVVHGDANFYNISADSTPEEKYRVGRNYLDGNMPRQAEKLIREAVAQGCSGDEPLYYWALSILSQRSFDHLGEEEFDQLSQSYAAAAVLAPSEWTDALAAIARLVQALIAQEENPDASLSEFMAAIDQYESLPAKRRDEIRRHLEMVLTGGIQDHLQARDAKEVAERRMGGGRNERGWMFFEQEPTPPRLLHPPESVPSGASIRKMAGGGALVALSVVVGWRALAEGPVVLLVLGLLLVGAGAFLFFTQGGEYAVGRAWVNWQRARFRDVTGYEGDDSREDRLGQAGRDAIANLYRACFAFQGDRSGGQQAAESRRRWLEQSKTVRSVLAKEVGEQFRDLDPRRLGAIEWLAKFHAEDTFRRWKSGDLLRLPKPDRPVLRGINTDQISLALLLLGAFVLLLRSVLAGSFWAVLVGVIVLVGCVRIYSGQNDRRIDAGLRVRHQKAIEERHKDEMAAYRTWRERLQARPQDAEMATWLDYDKAHVKALAMKHYGLSNRDLMAHVILTGPALVSYGARVMFGPPRYSAYVVELFLLTDHGVRQFSVQLNFLTGTVANEQRRAFQYDAIGSAEVAEVGVRIEGAKKTVVSPEEARQATPGSDKLVLSQEFRLTLNNRESVHVLVGNFDEGLVERLRENANHLFELARDSSGVTAAVRVLESVAAEGANWVQIERMRRRRRIRSYEQKVRERRVITRGRRLELDDSP